MLHVAFAGVWLGCVLTEVLFERAFLGKGREQEAALARLHVRVDLLVELPAMLGVLATGWMSLAHAAPSFWLSAKIGLGALAMLANVICFGFVLQRAACAKKGDWQGFVRADAWQHKTGAIVLIALLAAFGAGLFAL